MSHDKLRAHKDTVHANVDDVDEEEEDEKTFDCNHCDKTFNKQHLLNRHLPIHNEDEEKLAKRNARETKRNSNEEKVRQIFLMDCELCNVVFGTYRQAIVHYQDEHNKKGYLRCCDKRYFKLNRVLQHCEWHINPMCFKCNLCPKFYMDGTSLRDHVVAQHAPDSEMIFKCNICDKRFSRRHRLTSHQRLYHIPDADKKFECYHCGQRFVVLAFLRQHIRRVHDHVYSHVCDICAKLFRSASSYELHHALVHAKTKMSVQCDQCGRWLKHQKTLDKHMQWHTDKAVACPQCGKESPNKRALRAHIKLSHTEPAFSCTVCEKMFKKRQTLKEHMAIHAGVSDLYSCPFCAKTFRSSANMYAHRKRAHPVEYAQIKAEEAAKH